MLAQDNRFGPGMCEDQLVHVTVMRSWNSSFANWSPVAGRLFFSDIPSSSRSDRRQGRHSIKRCVFTWTLTWLSEPWPKWLESMGNVFEVFHVKGILEN